MSALVACIKLFQRLTVTDIVVLLCEDDTSNCLWQIQGALTISFERATVPPVRRTLRHCGSSDSTDTSLCLTLG